MQLKKPKHSPKTLSAATATLLAGISNPVQAADTSDWQAEAALLYYGEISRITAIEPVLNVKRVWSAEQQFSMNLVLDALAGASHNGAAVIDEAQTFTGASGNSSEEEDEDESGPQVFAAGEVPIIRGFEDTRVAVDLNYSQPIGSITRTAAIGSAFSVEEDYLSIGLNTAFGQEFDRRNTRISLSASTSLDIISPDNGLPKPMDLTDASVQTQEREQKWVVDVVLGLTQVVNKNAIAQFNFSKGYSTGYHNDPYKLISVLDSSNSLVEYRNEARPEQRNKYSLYGAIKYAIGKHSLTSSYRYYWDDWAIASHTVDNLFRFKLTEPFYVEAHQRWYQQTAADFFDFYLLDSDPLPTYASADHRLGNLQTTTYGITFGYQFAKNQSISWRNEWYHQADPIDGSLAAQMDVIISQVNYSLGF